MSHPPIALRMRRAVAGIGAAALIGGLLAAAPTAASAATTYTITGKVSYATKAKLKLSQGNIDLFNSKCDYVGDTRIVKLSWKGNRYTLKLNKPGKYRVVYSGHILQSTRTPYGISTAGCEAAKTIRVTGGKKASGNLAAKVNGNLSVTSKSADYTEGFRLFDAKTLKPVGWEGWGYPGSYKLALVKWSKAKNDYVIRKVFGTSSKSLKKGKTVVRKSAKAVSVNFEKRTVRTVKDFSYKANVSIVGTAKVGNTLTLKRSGFPAGTTFSYRWFSFAEAYQGDNIPGATGASFTVTEAVAGATLGVFVTVKKRGYLTNYVADYTDVQLMTLTQQTDQVVEGLSDDGLGGKTANVGNPVLVTDATFDRPVTASYFWFTGERVPLGSDSPSYTPTAEDAGTTIGLEVTYSRPGSRPVVKYISFQVNALIP